MPEQHEIEADVAIADAIGWLRKAQIASDGYSEVLDAMDEDAEPERAAELNEIFEAAIDEIGTAYHELASTPAHTSPGLVAKVRVHREFAPNNWIGRDPAYIIGTLDDVLRLVRLADNAESRAH